MTGKPFYPVSIMEFSGDKVAGEQNTLPIHSRLPHFALNGSNGWTHNLEVRESANNLRLASMIVETTRH